MNSLAENILYIYLFVFLSVLGFDVACIFIRKINNKRLKNLEKKIKVFFIKNQKQIQSIKIQKKLIHKIKNINYFIAFSNVIDKMTEKSKHDCLNCLKYTFLNILPHYQKEETIRQTYFVHFLAENPYIYNDNQNNIVNYLIKCTTAPSIYLRENALNALYKIGKVEYIKEALSKMNYLNIYHHHKLITDGLLTFQGNVKSLAKALTEDFKNYKEDYQVACINYFSYKKIDCKEYLYQVLIDELESKEVRLACIRYFKNNKYEKVVPVLYHFLKNDKLNWEYAAIAASTLSNYENTETTKQLIKALTSYNWYVRNNAAMSLSVSSNNDILKLIQDNIKDKYAREALIYQMKLQRKE